MCAAFGPVAFLAPEAIASVRKVLCAKLVPRLSHEHYLGYRSLLHPMIAFGISPLAGLDTDAVL